MRIQVNGESRELASGSTVQDLLESLKLDPRFLAVECNHELVSRAEHGSRHLVEGDEVEIVTLVGGG